MRRPWTRQPWTVTLLGAACYRLTRLATEDSFPPAAELRQRAETWLEQHAPNWAELPTCPWCTGLWVAALAAAGTEWADRRGRLDLALLAAAPLAISAAVGAISDREIH